MGLTEKIAEMHKARRSAIKYLEKSIEILTTCEEFNGTTLMEAQGMAIGGVNLLDLAIYHSSGMRVWREKGER